MNAKVIPLASKRDPAKEKQHVDDFISYGSWQQPITMIQEDLEAEKYARWVLCYFRMPATMQMDFKEFMVDHKLFCTYKGLRYKVTGASRMGDIWLARNLGIEHGYDVRPMPEDVSDWSKEP